MEQFDPVNLTALSDEEEVGWDEGGKKGNRRKRGKKKVHKK